MDADTRDQSVPCPRCGYDMRGEVARWTDAWPLTGRCNECGLDLDWPRILRWAEHPWLFEYYWRSSFRASLRRTVIAAMRPKRFWQEVDLTDPVHLRPVLLLIALPILILAVARFVSNLIVLSMFYSGATPGTKPDPWEFWRENSWFWAQWNNAVSWPGLERCTLDAFMTILPGPTAVQLAVGPAVALLLLMPIAFVLLPVTLRRAKVRPVHLARITLYSAVVPVWIVTIWGVLSVFLSINQWSADYSLYSLGSPWYERWTYNAEITWDNGLILLGLVALAGWSVYWWSCALTTYLQLKTARRILIAVSVITCLAVAVYLAKVIGMGFFMWLSGTGP